MPRHKILLEKPATLDEASTILGLRRNEYLYWEADDVESKLNNICKEKSANDPTNEKVYEAARDMLLEYMEE